MEPVTVLAWFGASVASGVAARAFRNAQRRRRAVRLRSVTESAGVRDLRLDRAGMLTGRSGALVVRVHSRNGFVRNVVHVVVSGLWADLTLAKAGGLRAVWRRAAADIALGDPDLDGRIALHAPPLGARSLFDAVTRARVRQVWALQAAVRVEAGELSAAFPESAGAPSPFDEPALRRVLDLARRLRAPDSPWSRLAHVASSDPLATIRAAALGTLAEEAPDREETRVALRACASDPEPRIRLQAARALGEEGHPTLLALAVDHRADDACGAEAIAALGDRLAPERARRILDWTAATGHAARARAALAAMEREGLPAAPFIAALLVRSPPRVAAAAAETLGAIGSKEAEAPLLAALESDELPVATAAATALGRLAAAPAVPALRAAARRRSALAGAANAAIAAIQSRLTGASPGQVSLADRDAGQVSVVDSGDGRVSLRSED